MERPTSSRLARRRISKPGFMHACDDIQRSVHGMSVKQGYATVRAQQANAKGAGDKSDEYLCDQS